MGKRSMKILIVGLPLFAEKLCQDLKNFDPHNQYYWLNTYYNKWHKIIARILIPKVDVIYSINGTLGKSRVFDLALAKNKKLMMTWVGTDVTKSKKIRTPNEEYLQKAHHFCEVSWIKDELKEMNIDAGILNFFNFKTQLNAEYPAGTKLKVLSYMAQNREDYYGYEKLMSAAKSFPNVDFTIIGTNGKNEKLSNVKFLGWVDNVSDLMEQHHVCLRLVEHDGLSGFILEALYKKRHVIYSEKLNHTVHVKSETDLHNALDNFKKKLDQQKLEANLQGKKFVEKSFNTDKILSELIEEFKS
jgi:hypothetical protein